MAEKSPGVASGFKSMAGKLGGCLLFAVAALLFMGKCGEQFGKNLERNFKEQAAKEEKQKAAEQERLTEIPGMTRQNPAGAYAALQYKAGGWARPEHTVELQVLKIVRGASAHEFAKKLNQFNAPPEGEQELMLLKVGIKVLKSQDKNSSASFYPKQFDLFSSSGASYQDDFVAGLEPRFSGELFEGGKASGWLAFKVRRDDSAPLLSYGRNSIDGTGGIWWRLD